MDEERDEKAMNALWEHERECAKRYEGFVSRFAKIEERLAGLADKVAANSRLLWWFGTSIVGLIVATNIREILT